MFHAKKLLIFTALIISGKLKKNCGRSERSCVRAASFLIATL
jgi:hypothetical protein